MDSSIQLCGMAVIAVTDKSVYIRLPRNLWRSAGNCTCHSCGGKEGFWDTLGVPLPPTNDEHPHQLTWTVHMPDPKEFLKHVNRQSNTKS